MDQAFKIFNIDYYSNALYIQEKVSESFGGKWNVEVLENAL